MDVAVGSVCAYLVGFVLMGAAVQKLGDLAAFGESVGKLLPHAVWDWRSLIAIGAVASELAIGTGSLFASDLATACGVALLLAFSAILFAAQRRPVPVVCGCFGRTTAPVTMMHVCRSLLLAACAALATVLPAEPALTARRPLQVLVALLCAYVIASADELVVAVKALRPKKAQARQNAGSTPVDSDRRLGGDHGSGPKATRRT